MIEAQGGRFSLRLPLAHESTLVASRSGTIHAIDGRTLGQAIIELGGGRKALGDPIDHSVGLEMLVRIGEHISVGQPIVKLFAANSARRAIAQSLIEQAIHITDQAPAATPLIVPALTRD